MLSIPVIGTWVALRGLRRRLPRRADHRPALHRPRAADPGDPARADRRCTCCSWSGRSTPSSPGPGRTEHNVVGEPALPDLRGEGRRPLLHRLRRLRRARRPRADQPDLAVRARTTRRRCRPARSRTGTSMFLDGSTRLFPSWEIRLLGDTRSRRCSGRRSCCRAILFTLLALYPFIEAQADRRHRVAPPAAASARRAGAHLARRDGADVLPGAVALRRQRRHRRRRSTSR